MAFFYAVYPQNNFKPRRLKLIKIFHGTFSFAPYEQIHEANIVTLNTIAFCQPFLRSRFEYDYVTYF